MDGFLDYLDEFNNKQQKAPQQKPVVKKVVVEQKEEINKPKVLCMNVEIRSVEGAQKVIDKLQEWISKQEIKEHFELKETPKPTYKIPPKKVIKNPILEAKSRAVDILDGLPDENIITEDMFKSTINNSKAPNNQQHNETVASHASALL